MEQLNTARGPLTIVPDCPAPELEKMGIDQGLGFFWHNRPDLQRQALVRIAQLPDGRVALARTADNIIVGYITITLPEPDTRWGKDHLPGLYEMGGIEVGRAWRGAGMARAILRSAFTPEAYRREIVIATGYRWCWDMEATGMTVREYRDMLTRMFADFGFQQYETDEPNIAWYPDNALIARVGPRVTSELLSKFKGLLFERPGSAYVSGEFMR